MIHHRMTCRVVAFAAACALVGVAGSAPRSLVLMSSHSDAPTIKQDPLANLTDVYAFVGRRYDNPEQTVLNLIANVRPFSEPGDGPHYERFANDARYSLHVADPASGETLVRYDFFFSGYGDDLKNPSTIISYGIGSSVGPIMEIGDANQNFTQFYRVERVENGATSEMGMGLVAPPNPGKRVTPSYNDAEGKARSGASTLDELDPLTRQAITELEGGIVAWAGPRDDSFYGDVPGVFDLLDPRILETDGNGVDGFKGFNVLTFAIQIPIEQLPGLPYEDFFFGSQTGVGVYASVSRPRTRSIRPNGQQQNVGPWVQVNRLGNPLFNEVLVALRDKDRYNRFEPTKDHLFRQYAAKPEVARLINFVFGTQFAEMGRVDLVAIFIPDVLRVSTTTGPVRLDGEDGFSRLGFIGGDTTDGVSSGWPNGRRMGDDVIDIALTAIASGPGYGEIVLIGDNVLGNDLPYNQVFPYAATPHAGTLNRKDPTQ